MTNKEILVNALTKKHPPTTELIALLDYITDLEKRIVILENKTKDGK